MVGAGAELLGRVPGPGVGWSADATVLAVPAADLTPGSRLLEECFGPVAVVAEYADRGELAEVLAALPGALAASVMSAGRGDPETAGLVAALARLVGRVAVDDWPTGVAFTWAQQHGGPWPATTVPSATSVRRRRARPVHPAGHLAVDPGGGAAPGPARREPVAGAAAGGRPAG